MKMYETEFCFKLNSDEQLVYNTMRSAQSFLNNKIQRLDDKISHLNAKNNHYDRALLQREIKELQDKI